MGLQNFGFNHYKFTDAQDNYGTNPRFSNLSSAVWHSNSSIVVKCCKSFAHVKNVSARFYCWLLKTLWRVGKSVVSSRDFTTDLLLLLSIFWFIYSIYKAIIAIPIGSPKYTLRKCMSLPIFRMTMGVFRGWWNLSYASDQRLWTIIEPFG